MPAPDAAVLHYATQQAITRRITTRAQRIWTAIDPSNLAGSWNAGLADQMFATTSAGQLLAAAQADTYLDRVLLEQGIANDRTGSVNARAFAGIASDGRSLDTLLVEPIIATKVAIANGAGTQEALRVGEGSLVRIVSTQLQDAGRTSVGTGIIARPAVTSYTRMLSPPSCSRCAVLAGKVFKYNQGFQRHPHCDCRHIASSEDIAGDLTTSPQAYFDSLSPSDQAKYFTEAGAQAIRDGADLGQVVNSRRGMYQANGKAFTTEGTTKRGFAGKRLNGEARPAPESIYDGAPDRAAAVADLKKYGYLL